MNELDFNFRNPTIALYMGLYKAGNTKLISHSHGQNFSQGIA